MQMYAIKHWIEKVQQQRQMKVKELPHLLQRMATLLNEGYVLVDCITMLLPYHVKNFPQWQQNLQMQFESGASLPEIFRLFGLKQQYLLAISLAQFNGQLPEILQAVSKQMLFDEQARKKLYKMLAYPIILFVFLVGLFIAFRSYFLPNIYVLFDTRTNSAQPNSLQWSSFFLHIPDYVMLVAFICLSTLIISFYYIRNKRVDIQLEIILRIPFIRYFWRLVLTRQFAQALSSLLMTGFSLQQSLAFLKEQAFQPQVSYIAENIEQRIIFGDSLAVAVSLVHYFYPRFDQFIDHGEKSGLLGRELKIYCDLLDEKMTALIQILLAILQPLLFAIIAICIVAAYLSILLPMYNLMELL